MSKSSTGVCSSAVADELSRPLYIVSLTTVLLACLNVPEYFNELLGFPLPQTGYFLPYLAPLSLLFTLAILRLCYPRTPARIPFGRPDVLFLMALGLWMGQELFWSVKEATPFNLGAIMPLTWFYFFYLMLRIHHQGPDFRQMAMTLLIAIVGALSAFHLVLHTVVSLQQEPNPWFFNFVRGNNGLSFMALLAVTTRMFLYSPGPSRRINRACDLFTVASLAAILMNATRGAITLFALLVLLRVFFIESIRLRVIVLGVMSVGAAGFVSLQQEFVLRVLQDNFLFGITGDVYLPDSEVAVLPRGAGSTYARNMANALLFERLQQVPMWGMGLTAAEGVTVVGMGSHTLPLVVLAAYGVVGSAPFLVLLGYAFFTGWRRCRRAALSLGIVLAGTMIFIPDIKSWYAFAVSAMFFCRFCDATVPATADQAV